MHTLKTPAAYGLLVATIVGCTDRPLPTAVNESGPLLDLVADTVDTTFVGQDSTIVAAMGTILDQTNVTLAAQDAGYRAAMIQYLASGEAAGATVLAKDVGNKQLGFDFVPFDPRRSRWSGPTDGPDDDITYAIEEPWYNGLPPRGGLTFTQVADAIDGAMATWAALRCLSLRITKRGVMPFYYFQFPPVADIEHAGFPDFGFPGGVLAYTITFGFLGPYGYTDIDGNGKLDVAFRVIIYNPNVYWTDAAGTYWDLQSVALHEAGHGLSQDHFGNLFIGEDGSLVRAPAAVMNALALNTRTLLGTDVAGHCSIWAQWPVR